MKITLVVLFLAGLTIYCKCTPVLSLPPSLIAHAASLEERLKTQKPTTTKLTETRTDNGSDVVAAAAEQLEAQQNDEEELQDANNLAEDFYKNLKNLWQKDLSLNLQKRERQTFEDDIVNSATQQQPPTTIKNNNKIALEQQQHNDNNNNNNLFKTTSSAATINEATNFNIDSQHDQQQLVSEEYDSNEWLPPSTADLTNDDMIQTLLSPRPSETNLESTPSQLQDVDDAVVWNKYLKPLKYWTRQCQSENENENCPQEYYRSLIADRNNALIKQLQYKKNLQNLLTPTTPATFLNVNPFYSSKDTEISSNLPLDYNRINNDDITLLLTAEQNLIQFLSWALAELYPFGKFENQSVDGADFYHPGMYMWKKLNLSGRLEPPLLVDEPRYVIVRREYGQNNYDDDYKKGLNYGGDPFIPPRGRKHNLPDLDSLLHRYETFVPNRGRRDKIRDIFKYDDLFYPNRGKRQMTMAPIDIGCGVVADERSDNDGDDDEDEEEENQLNNYEENVEQQLQQYPLSANEMTTMEHIKNLMAKMKRKLHQNHRHEEGQQKIENSFDEMSRNEPTRMSTTFQQQQLPPPSLLSKRFKSMFNILHKQQRRQQQHATTANPRRQWLKRYTTTATTNNDRSATVRSRTMATNRLQTLRSMSPLQQLTQLYQQQHHPEQQQQLENQHLQQHHHHHLQQPDYISSPTLWKTTTKFMWQPPKQQQQLQQLQQQPLKSLAQQFDPLSWHKLQMLQHQYQHQPLLTMRHPRLTALQHLPSIQQQHQQQHQQHRQLATPQETQLTYSSDQIDNSITNDLQNFFNKDLD